MRTKSFTIVALAIFAWACSNNDEVERKNNYPEIELNTHSVSVLKNSKDGQVWIEKGSKRYEIGVEDDSIAEVEIVFTESHPYGTIVIYGNKLGKTTITIKDIVWQREASLDIEVRESVLRLHLFAFGISTIPNNFYIPWDFYYSVQGDGVFRVDEDYLFSDSYKGVFSDSDYNKRSYRHFMEKDDVYIVIGRTDEPQESNAHRLRVLPHEYYGSPELFNLYLNFFGLPSGVLVETPHLSHDYIQFEEDLMERYKAEGYDPGEMESILAGYYGYFSIEEMQQ